VPLLGENAAHIFAIALLFAGIASTTTAGMAGVTIFSLPLPTVSIILHHRTSYGNLFALPEAGDVYSPSMILNAPQKKKKFGCFGTVVKSKSIMLRFVW
jgi:Mn2+/Fe2+ NRAMP family transporter